MDMILRRKGGKPSPRPWAGQTQCQAWTGITYSKRLQHWQEGVTQDLTPATWSSDQARRVQAAAHSADLRSAMACLVTVSESTACCLRLSTK